MKPHWPTPQSLRRIAHDYERDRAVNNIVPAARQKILLDAIFRVADVMDRRRLLAERITCAIIAVLIGVGVAALVLVGLEVAP